MPAFLIACYMQLKLTADVEFTQDHEVLSCKWTQCCQCHASLWNMHFIQLNHRACDLIIRISYITIWVSFKKNVHLPL